MIQLFANLNDNQDHYIIPIGAFVATAMEEDPKDFGFFFLQRSEVDGNDSVLS